MRLGGPLGLVRDVVDLLVPRRCGGCERPASGLFCDDCLTRCRRPPGPVCMRCGGGHRPAGCGRCQRFGRPFAFRSAAAMWTYAGPVRQLVHGFKYGGRRELLPACGRALASEPALVGSLADALVCGLPARRTARKRRGYDQAVELARGLARAAGRPFAEAALQRRRPHELPQAGADMLDRRRQVRGAFRAHAAAVAHRRVALVDDVISTGASLDAAARALLLAGARDVRVVVLAA